MSRCSPGSLIGPIIGEGGCRWAAATPRPATLDARRPDWRRLHDASPFAIQAPRMFRRPFRWLVPSALVVESGATGQMRLADTTAIDA